MTEAAPQQPQGTANPPEHVRASGLNSRLLTMALSFGLVRWEWTVKDYIRHAAQNMQYETVHVWGIQGAKKSNLTLQLGYMMLEDWDQVLKYLVFRPGKEERGFLKLIKSIGEGNRIPWAGWDDLGVHFPSTSWRTDMPKYQAIDAVWAAIRTKISVVTTNNPNIDRVSKNIKDNISIEIWSSPNQTLVTERLCRIPGLKDIDSHFFKVPIEPPHRFDWTAVPSDVWKEYWELRLRVSEEAIQKLDEAYADDVDLNEWVPLYDIIDQGIATPSQVIAYSTRDLITVCKVGGKRYVRKSDVEHILSKLAKPKAQKVSLA
jgi:hypothetical protein